LEWYNKEKPLIMRKIDLDKFYELFPKGQEVLVKKTFPEVAEDDDKYCFAEVAPKPKKGEYLLLEHRGRDRHAPKTQIIQKSAISCILLDSNEEEALISFGNRLWIVKKI
jgi:hypothetical protein